MSCTMRKILTVLGVVALLLVGAYTLGFFDSEQPRAAAGGPPKVTVGQCATVSRVVNEPRFTPADCGSDQANVKVAKVLDQAWAPCPTGGAAYSTFTSTNTLCLMPNLVEGSCYGESRAAGLAKVPCGTAKAVKVVKVLGGGAACGEQRAVAYPEPAVTFCLEDSAG
ncbi:hypothetical protein [Umezawaea sp. NPDC059074]|uniref:LppU/SCO3897 family protein n=1 Tax=Umezawaea sp. NPDC059074 TaxID=3346716 RepID=UPI0036CABD39